MEIRATKEIDVGVYLASTPSAAPPDCYIEAQEAARVVRNGDAKRINRGKGIRLRTGLKIIQAGSVECRARFASSGVA